MQGGFQSEKDAAQCIQSGGMADSGSGFKSRIRYQREGIGQAGNRFDESAFCRKSEHLCAGVRRPASTEKQRLGKQSQARKRLPGGVSRLHGPSTPHQTCQEVVAGWRESISESGKRKRSGFQSTVFRLLKRGKQRPHALARPCQSFFTQAVQQLPSDKFGLQAVPQGIGKDADPPHVLCPEAVGCQKEEPAWCNVRFRNAAEEKSMSADEKPAGLQLRRLAGFEAQRKEIDGAKALMAVRTGWAAAFGTRFRC